MLDHRFKLDDIVQIPSMPLGKQTGTIVFIEHRTTGTYYRIQLGNGIYNLKSIYVEWADTALMEWLKV